MMTNADLLKSLEKKKAAYREEQEIRRKQEEKKRADYEAYTDKKALRLTDVLAEKVKDNLVNCREIGNNTQTGDDFGICLKFRQEDYFQFFGKEDPDRKAVMLKTAGYLNEYLSDLPVGAFFDDGRMWNNDILKITVFVFDRDWPYQIKQS